MNKIADDIVARIHADPASLRGWLRNSGAQSEESPRVATPVSILVRVWVTSRV